MLTRHIRESLQVTPGPFPDFWVGPGDEASLRAAILANSHMTYQPHPQVMGEELEHPTSAVNSQGQPLIDS